jgi:hypothetical protein
MYFFLIKINNLKNFNLYVTGILDNGDPNEKIKNNFLHFFKKIKNKIFKHYDKINIYFYDPYNQNITIKLTDLINEENVTSYFYNEYFDKSVIEKIKNTNNHLIIDYAHIFKYTNKKGIVKWNETYVQYGDDQFEINVIRTTWPGYYLHIIKTFEFIDGNIVTYIDKMIENNLISKDIDEPIQIIIEFSNKLQHELWKYIDKNNFSNDVYNFDMYYKKQYGDKDIIDIIKYLWQNKKIVINQLITTRIKEINQQ